MGISRLHIALLSIMSIFTGIIAPGTSVMGNHIAYPMTDARILSYMLLFFLIIGFYTASIHAWKIFRYNGILILGMISVLFFLTLSGQVVETKTGIETSGFSWGWIFLLIGVIILFRIYTQKDEDENASDFKQTIDTLLGIVGSFTLACIAGVIILISLSFTDKSHKTSVLEEVFGRENITYMSGGIILSAPYMEISELHYDRKTETFLLTTKDQSGSIIRLKNPRGVKVLTGSIGKPVHINDQLYTTDAEQRAYSGGILLPGATIIGKDTLLLHSGSDWNIRSTKSSWSFDYSGSISNPVLSGDKKVIAWTEKTASGKTIIKKIKGQEGGEYEKVYSMNLSTGGYDLMSLVMSSGGLQIVKNGETLWKVESGYQTGTYISNGSHNIYIISQDREKKIVYDGQILSPGYDDIRELFLENNGGYYAYFAKPIGGMKYCLFTKYRGNLCGFDGYMNPTLSADGSSLIYAGLMNGTWNIYRNTEVLVQNTHYQNTDISHDYVFFDVTNPRTYLFVRRDDQIGKYSLIKNGVVLPGLWDDFGTEVSFGYDNHIILKLKDQDGWRIAEL